ncbi:MAG: transposase [Acinetobacter bohemicus]
MILLRWKYKSDCKSISLYFKYLPPYSSEFNLIEKYWALLKQKTRLLLFQQIALFGCFANHL